MFLPNIPSGKFRSFLISIVVCFACSGSVHAQRSPSSEADLKKQAEKRFNSDDYISALPFYSQLLSIYPQNPEYNYRYGVCLLQSSKDKATAVSYLESASRFPKTDEEVFFYLGKSYMLTNNYTQALQAFENFKKRAGAGKAKKMNVDVLTGNCKSAMEMMKNRRNVVIINQQQVVRNSFYGAYAPDSSCGKLLVTPERFLTPRDKDKMQNPLMFLTGDGQAIYYASYGKNGDKGKDIYRMTKQVSGVWGAPENLGDVINTGQDEDYPFLDRDGITLYFCSRGHNSIGGYDIFKSVFDFNSGQWSAPENAGIPINTPDDDIFYMPNATGDCAQYSCAMESDLGKIGVRKIKLGDVLNHLAVVNGEYFSEDQPQRRDAKISVIRIKDNGLVTTVRTDPRTGKYVFQIPPGDNYTLVVEAGGYVAHAENFSLAQDLSMTELKQRVQLDKNSESERMTLSNYFTVNKISTDQSFATVSEEPTNVISNEYRIKDADVVKLQPVDIRGRTVYVIPPKNIVDAKPEVQSNALNEQKVNAGADNAQTQNGTDQTNARVNERETKVPPHIQSIKATRENKHLQAEARKEKTKPEEKNDFTVEKIPDDVSNNELVKIAFEDAKARRAEAQIYEENAKTTRQLATEQDSLAKSQLKEVMLLLKDNSPANKEHAKALMKESEDNHNMAKARFEKAEDLDAEAKQLNSEADESMREMQALIKSAQKDNAKTASSKGKDHSSPKADINSSETNTKDNKSVASSVNPKEEKRKKQATVTVTGHSTGNENAKTGADSYSSSQPANKDSKNDEQPVTFNPTKESHTENISTQPASNNSSDKAIAVASEKANELYVEHRKLINESKELTAQAGEIKVRVDNMPESPQRENLIVKANDLNMLSLKKWQQAQEKLTEAKMNDPEVEARMKAVEKINPAQDAANVNLTEAKQTQATDSKKTSSEKNLLASNTHVKTDAQVLTGRIEQAAIEDDKKSLDTESPLYLDYVATTTEIKIKQNTTIDVFAEAIRLNKRAEEKKEEEKRVRDDAAAISNSKRKNQELKKADALKHEVDSLTACSDKKFKEAQQITGEVAALNEKASKLKKQMNSATQAKRNEATASVNTGENKIVQSKSIMSDKEPITGTQDPILSNKELIAGNKKAVAGTRELAGNGNPITGNKETIVGNEELVTKHPAYAEASAGRRKPGTDNQELLADATPHLGKVNPGSIYEFNNSGENIFSLTSKPLYSASHPIPIDPGLPGGLIFKVQIGAFHSPLPSQTFKNLRPVTGETTRPGWIRYCVGLFKAFEAANLLKSEMKSLGYKDAFVVAYYNGKRITLSEAYALINRSGTEEKKLYASTIKNETSHLRSLNITSPKLNDPRDADMNSFYGMSQDILAKNNSGTLYAVQVGVYKTSRVPNALVSLVPLQAEQTDKGLYRFRTGHYSLYASADSSKRAAIRAGIKDAFIVKYKNGNTFALYGNKTISEKAGLLNKQASRVVYKFFRPR